MRQRLFRVLRGVQGAAATGPTTASAAVGGASSSGPAPAASAAAAWAAAGGRVRDGAEPLAGLPARAYDAPTCSGAVSGGTCAPITVWGPHQHAGGWRWGSAGAAALPAAARGGWAAPPRSPARAPWECPPGTRGIVLAPSAEAPRAQPHFRRLRDADDVSKWKRMVVRIPPQVQVELEADTNVLLLSGRSGSARLNLSHLDPTGLVAMQLWRAPPPGAAAAGGGDSAGSGSLLLCASPSKRYFRGIQTHVDNAVHGVMQGYLVGVTVKGVGYRLEPADASDSIKRPPGAPPSQRRLFWEPGGEKVNVQYPHKQPSRVVRLKVGYTHSAVYKLPDGVVALFVKPTLVYLYGVDKALVTGAASALRAVRPPNEYTGNGVLLVGEEVKLRQRAGSK